MSELGLQFPHVLVWILRVVDANLSKNFLQVHRGLLSFVYQVTEAVVLVLLESSKNEVQNYLPVISGSSSSLLDQLLVLRLQADQADMYEACTVDYHRGLSMSIHTVTTTPYTPHYYRYTQDHTLDCHPLQ